MPRHILLPRISRTLVLTLSAWLIACCCHAQQTPPMVISTDKPSGVYQVGDTVYWTIQWQGVAPALTAHYVLKSRGATEIAHGDLTFTGGTAMLASKIPKPNTMLLEVDWPSDGHPGRAFGGAFAAPDQIKPAAPEPSQFAAFGLGLLSLGGLTLRDRRRVVRA